MGGIVENAILKIKGSGASMVLATDRQSVAIIFAALRALNVKETSEYLMRRAVVLFNMSGDGE